MPDVVGARSSCRCGASRGAPGALPRNFCARGSSHMGRGRAKAKQTKVARELKYHSPNTDLNALQRELAGKSKANDEFDNNDELFDEDDDADDFDDDSEDGGWAARSR